MKRLLLFILFLTWCTYATHLNKTIRTGGDYTSLSACFTANTAMTQDTLNVLIDSSFTESNFITIADDYDTKFISCSTSARCRHAGVYDSTKYVLTANQNTVLQIDADKVDLKGLQILHTATGNSDTKGILIAPSAGAVKVHSCIIVGTGTSDNLTGIYINWQSTGTHYIYNNLVYGFDHVGGVGIKWETWTGTGYFYNNTVAHCAAATVCATQNMVVVNGLYVSNTDDGAGSLTDSYCSSTLDNTHGLHSDGTGNRFSQTFTFVNSTSRDYRLTLEDVGAKGHGLTDPGSGLYSDDITGDSRVTLAWDIGADQAASTFTPTDIYPKIFNWHHRKLFNDQFEITDLSSWDYDTGSTNVISLSQNKRFSGKKSVLFQMNTATSRAGLKGLYKEAFDKSYTRCYFYLDSNFVLGTNQYFGLISAGGTSAGAIISATLINSSGNIRLCIGAYGSTSATGTTNLQTKKWYCLELKYIKGTGSNAVGTIYLDSVQECTSSSLSQTSATNEVIIGASDNISSDVRGSVYIDDVIADTALIGPSTKSVTLYYPNLPGRLSAKIIAVFTGDTITDSIKCTLTDSSVYSNVLINKRGVDGLLKFSVNLTDLVESKYKLLFKVFRIDSLSCRDSILFYKNYAGNLKLTIDSNNNIIKDGRKFFPVTGFGTDRRVFKTWKDSSYQNMGYGIDWPNTGGGLSSYSEYVDSCRKYGWMIVGPAHDNRYDSTHSGPHMPLSSVSSYLNQFKNDTTVGAWIFREEPDLFTYYPDTTKKWWDSVRVIAPKQLNEIMFMGGGYSPSQGDGARHTIKSYSWPYLQGDIYSWDYYPNGYQNSDYAAWADEQDRANRWNLGLVPIFSNVQTTALSNEYPQMPTPQEIKLMSWLMIIHGAKGIHWYPYQVTVPDANYAAMRAFVRSLDTLTPIVLGDSSTLRATVTVSGGGRTDFVIKDTSFNRTFLIAANPKHSSNSTTFKLSGDYVRANVLGEGRAININSDSTFTDNFDSLSVHIYQLKRACYYPSVSPSSIRCTVDIPFARSRTFTNSIDSMVLIDSLPTGIILTKSGSSVGTISGMAYDTNSTILFRSRVYACDSSSIVTDTIRITASTKVIGDITNFVINPDGWTANVSVKGLNTGGVYNFGFGANKNPANAKLKLFVKSFGYDTLGNATFINDTIIVDTIIRKRTPNDAQDSAYISNGKINFTLALSRFIFVKDSIKGFSIVRGLYSSGTDTMSNNNFVPVVNNSTAKYSDAKVVANWIWPGYQQVKTPECTLEVFASHWSARKGKPAACVKITVSDQHGNTTYHSVGFPYISSRTDTGKTVCFVVRVPMDNFVQGDSLTANFWAYPFIGDDSTITKSEFGSTYAPLYAPQVLLCDKEGTYGSKCAVVGDTTGQAGAGEIIALSAFVPGSPPRKFKYIADAANAMAAQNNSDYSRNNCGGGVIYLTKGNHLWLGGTINAETTPKTWVTISGYPGVSRDSVIINDQSGDKNICSRIKIENLTITSNSATSTFDGMQDLWFNNVVFNSSATALFYTNTREYFTNIFVKNLTNGICPYAAEQSAEVLIRGSNLTGCQGYIQCYTVVGNYTSDSCSASWRTNGSGWSTPIPTGMIFYNNKLYGHNNGGDAGWRFFADQNNTFGFAFIQNIIEDMTTSKLQALVAMMADGSSGTPNNNTMAWYNTVVKNRWNYFYNDAGSTPTYRIYTSMVNNIIEDPNIKTDVFGTPSPGRVGNWSDMYGVGWSGNALLEVANLTGGSGSFPVYFPGLYGVQPTYPTVTYDSTWVKFVDRKENYQSGGNYHLQATSPVNRLARRWLLPYDIDGNRRGPGPNDTAGMAPGVYAYDENWPGTCAATTITYPTVSIEQNVSTKITPTISGPYDSINFYSLPPGLTCNPLTGVITGVPTTIASKAGFKYILHNLICYDTTGYDSITVIAHTAGTRTWTASDSTNNTNWSNSSNWSPSGAPGSSDSVIFNASGGSKTPSVDVSPSIGNLRLNSTFTRNLDFSGKTLTIAKSFYDSALTGTITYPDSLVMTGSGKYMTSAASPARTSSNTVFAVYGAYDTCLDRKGETFKRLHIGGTFVNNGTATTIFSSNNLPLVMENNSNIISTRQMNFDLTGDGRWHFLKNTYSKTGAGDIAFRFGANNLHDTLPAITLGGGGILFGNVASYSADTMYISGKIKSNTVMTMTFGTASTKIAVRVLPSCDSIISTTTMSLGNSTANSITDYDFGNSVIKCVTAFSTSCGTGNLLVNINNKLLVGANVTLDVDQKSAWTGTGNIVTYGTCTFTTNALAVSVLPIVDSLGAFTLTGNLKCGGFKILSGNSNNCTWAGDGVTISGNYINDGTGTMNMGTGLTLIGSFALCHIGSGTGVQTATAITWNGDSGSFDDDKGITFATWTNGASGRTTFIGSANTILANASSNVILKAGTVLDNSFLFNATNINLTSSVCNSGGSWTYGTQTINPGTGCARFTTTATVTSAGSSKKFNCFRIIGNSGTTLTLGDSLYCNMFRDSSGKFKQNAKTLKTDSLYVNMSPDSSIQDAKHFVGGDFIRGAGTAVYRSSGAMYFDSTRNHSITLTNNTIGPCYAKNLTFLDSGIIQKITFYDSAIVKYASGKGIKFDTLNRYEGSLAKPVYWKGPGRVWIPKSDTVSYHVDSAVTIKNGVLTLDSMSRTLGYNSGVKSLSFYGVTKNKTTAPQQTPITFTGYGFTSGSGWSIGSTVSTLGYNNYTQAVGIVPLVDTSTLAVKVWNSDGDTVSVGSLKVNLALSKLKRFKSLLMILGL